VKAGVALIDEVTALYAHGAVLAALRHRDRTGLGQRIDCSLLECGVAAMMNAASNYLVAGTVPRRWGSAQESVVPYQAFRARDDYLIIGAGNDRLWRRLCSVLGVPSWSDDPRFRTNRDRAAHRETLVALIEERLATRTRDEWIADLAAAGIPAGPINTVDQVFKDPQVLHRSMVEEVQHPTAGTLRLVGIPVKFSASPAAIRLAPPLLGEHTRDILTELGVAGLWLAELEREGVIST
jgi:crotonobetainyl-CoA:carnitine CoA-transferase CaiB-like acyl-CoA transferase